MGTHRIHASTTSGRRVGPPRELREMVSVRWNAHRIRFEMVKCEKTHTKTESKLGGFAYIGLVLLVNVGKYAIFGDGGFKCSF